MPPATGIPAVRPSASAAGPASRPTSEPVSPVSGIRSAGMPAAVTSARSGTSWFGVRGATASPVSRNASHSQVERYQRVASAAARSCRSTQSAAGRPASAQPRTPVASASSSASAMERVSIQVIAGRVASPRPSTATSVGPCPSTPIATTSATSVTRSARTAETTADHQAPGSCSAQPGWRPTSSA